MGVVNKENVREVFTYHAPSPEQVEKMEQVRAKIIELAELTLDVMPDCADKSAALRQLREFRMTVNAGIVLNGLI